MKSLSSKSRRDLLFVTGATLLALVPLGYLWRKSTLSPRVQFAAAPTKPTLKPFLPRLATGENSSISSDATLSPDGRFIARMEPPISEIWVEGATPKSPALADELVIRSSTSGKELFREKPLGSFVGWLATPGVFAIENGDDLEIFSPATRKPGAPRPIQFWTSKTISFSEDEGGISESWSVGGPRTEASLTLQAGVIRISPDGRFAVKASWGGGDIWWQVADLRTGTMAPLVKAGRYLPYDPKVGGFKEGLTISIAPVSLARGALPLVCVSQTTDFVSRTAPTPVPTPTPRPIPTPTSSPAQAEFSVRAAREEAEIQALVESVLGVDGADPVVTDEAEVARVEAAVKKRNRALEAERERMFPALKQARLNAQKPPAPHVATLADGKRFQIECFDLNRARRVWTTSVYGDIFAPQSQFSPDGSAFVVWGTAVIEKEGRGASLADSGLQFLDPQTGRLRGAAQLWDEDFELLSDDNINFHGGAGINSSGVPTSILVIKDSLETGGQKTADGTLTPWREVPALRFFDMSVARETGHLKLDSKIFDPNFLNEIETVAPDGSGQVWLLGRRDYWLLSRAQLGREFASPLPKPTPQATPTQSF